MTSGAGCTVNLFSKCVPFHVFCTNFFDYLMIANNWRKL